MNNRHVEPPEPTRIRPVPEPTRIRRIIPFPDSERTYTGRRPVAQPVVPRSPGAAAVPGGPTAAPGDTSTASPFPGSPYYGALQTARTKRRNGGPVTVLAVFLILILGGASALIWALTSGNDTTTTTSVIPPVDDFASGYVAAMNERDGEAAGQLRCTPEDVSFTGLPPGVDFQVTETNAQGVVGSFTVSSTGDGPNYTYQVGVKLVDDKWCVSR